MLVILRANRIRIITVSVKGVARFLKASRLERPCKSAYNFSAAPRDSSLAVLRRCWAHRRFNLESSQNVSLGSWTNICRPSVDANLK